MNSNWCTGTGLELTIGYWVGYINNPKLTILLSRVNIVWNWRLSGSSVDAHTWAWDWGGGEGGSSPAEWPCHPSSPITDSKGSSLSSSVHAAVRGTALQRGSTDCCSVNASHKRRCISSNGFVLRTPRWRPRDARQILTDRWPVSHTQELTTRCSM